MYQNSLNLELFSSVSIPTSVLFIIMFYVCEIVTRVAANPSNGIVVRFNQTFIFPTDWRAEQILSTTLFRLGGNYCRRGFCGGPSVLSAGGSLPQRQWCKNTYYNTQQTTKTKLILICSVSCARGKEKPGRLLGWKG